MDQFIPCDNSINNNNSIDDDIIKTNTTTIMDKQLIPCDIDNSLNNNNSTINTTITNQIIPCNIDNSTHNNDNIVITKTTTIDQLIPYDIYDIIRNNIKNNDTVKTNTTTIGQQLIPHDIDNSIAFFKIWRNMIIKKEIDLYIRHHTKELNDLNSLTNFSNKRYVVKLIINACYDYSSNNAIMEYVNVEHLKLGNKYKKYTIKVPPNVKIVEIGDSFNQPLVVRDPVTDRFTYSIPEGVEKLIFGVSFNDPIFYGELPKSLKCLKFHKQSKHNRILVTPKGLTHLKLGQSCNAKIGINSLELNRSITNLDLGSKFNGVIKEVITNETKYLLPDNLKKLNLGSFNEELSKGDIPKTVTKLIFRSYDKPLVPFNSIPFSVTYLDLGYNFKQTLLPGSIPIFVKTLKIRASFYQECLDNILPFGLENLHLPYKYSNSAESIRKILPNLKELTFSYPSKSRIKRVKEKIDQIISPTIEDKTNKKRKIGNGSIISEFNHSLLISILLLIITVLLSMYIDR